MAIRKRTIKYHSIEAHLQVKVQMEELGSDVIIAFDDNGRIPKGYRVQSVSRYAFDGTLILNVVKESL